MGLELAKAYVTARGDASKVAGDLRGAKGDVAGAASSLQSTINGILATIGVGLSIGKIISEMREGIGLAQVQIDSEAKVAAIIKGTGSAAGFTANELKKMASELQEATTFGDESILQLQARLLTFKTITGDVFESATKVALNMSATLGTDASGAAIQLGRALEDPIRGVTALRRTGVSFTDQQKEYIKQLVESNQLGKAQAFILDTVQGQLGDVAAAMAETDSGKLKQAQNTLGDIKEELGKKVLPAQIKFVEMQMKMTEGLTRFVGLVQSISRPLQNLSGDIIKMTLVTAALSVGVYQLTGSFGALRVALTFLTAHPIILFLTGLAAVLVTVHTEWNEYNKEVEKGNALTGGAVGAVNNQIAAFKGRMDQLKELKGKTFGDDEEFENAKALVEQLSAHYTTLDIKLNKAGDGFVGITDAVNEMSEANKRMKLGGIDHHIDDIKKQMLELIGSTDKARGRFARFHERAMKTTDLAGGILAFEEFWKGDEDKATALKVLREELKRILELREEIANQPTKVEEEATAAVTAEEEERKTGVEKIWPSIYKVLEEEMKLRDELAGLDPVVEAFKRKEFITQVQIDAFTSAHNAVEELKEEMKDVQELKGLEDKWAKAIETPLDRYRQGMEEIARLRKEDELTKEQLARGEEMLKKRLDEEEGRGKDTTSPFGRSGFAEFGTKIQDMLLQQGDPQKKIEENTGKSATSLGNIDKQFAEFIARTGGSEGYATYAKGGPA